MNLDFMMFGEKVDIVIDWRAQAYINIAVGADVGIFKCAASGAGVAPVTALEFVFKVGVRVNVQDAERFIH